MPRVTANSPHICSNLGDPCPPTISPGSISPAATFLHVHRCLLIPRNSSSSKPLLPSSPDAGSPFPPRSLLERNPLATSPLRIFRSTRTLFQPALPPRIFDAVLLKTITFQYHLPNSAYSTCFTGYTSTVSPASTLPCKPTTLFPALDQTLSPGLLPFLPPSFTPRISSEA